MYFLLPFFPSFFRLPFHVLFFFVRFFVFSIILGDFHPFSILTILYYHLFIFPRFFLVFSNIYIFVGLFRTRTSMLSLSIFSANTAQQGAISPAQSSKACSCRSERDNASKQTEVAKASMSGICSALCSLNERRSRNLPDLQKQTTAHMQQKMVCAKDLSLLPISITYDTTLSLRPFYLVLVHVCGVRVVFLDHGALGICNSSVCTYNHGPLLSDSFAFRSILPCGRS